MNRRDLLASLAVVPGFSLFKWEDKNLDLINTEQEELFEEIYQTIKSALFKESDFWGLKHVWDSSDIILESIGYDYLDQKTTITILAQHVRDFIGDYREELHINRLPLMTPENYTKVQECFDRAVNELREEEDRQQRIADGEEYESA